MERLIPVVNKLQDVFDKVGSSSSEIQLPQIVSSGKSSVLESLVGKPFLPRGDGMVTRVPIVLKLMFTPGGLEWCEFEHKGDTRFEIKDVKDEILRRTDEIAGKGFGISYEKIKLTVYSPNVLTLTVVDLPGLVKVPLDGQPANIADEIEKMVVTYISEPSTIILAISSADVDIANSDSLKMAQTVDPLQERTVAVITKLDRVTDNDLTDVLNGKTISIKLGIIGVINRSKTELASNTSTEDVIKKEREFFQKNYGPIAKFHGIPFLAQRLNQILLQHIKKCCPTLDMKIKDIVRKRQLALDELGGEGDDEMTSDEKLKILSEIITQFSNEYKAQIDGQGRCTLDPSTLSGSSQIDFVFASTLKQDLTLLDPLDQVTDQEVMNALRNSGGVTSRLFHPEGALQFLIKREITKIKPVALHCADLVHQVMIDIIKKAEDRSHRFQDANIRIARIVHRLLDQRIEKARDILENYIDVQASAALTFNSEYHKELVTSMSTINPVGLGDMPTPQVLNGTGELGISLLTLSSGGTFTPDSNGWFTDSQLALCQHVKKLMASFFDIVRLQVQDHIPKSLLHSLIYYTVDHVNTELMRNLYDRDEVDQVIKEPDNIAEQRKVLKMELESFRTAAKILDEVRDES